MKCVLFPYRKNRDWDRFREDVMTGILNRDSAKCDNSEFDIVKAKKTVLPLRQKQGMRHGLFAMIARGAIIQ